jgi:hypothetical protein
MTAAEYIRQTEGDPAYQARLRKMEATREQLRQRCIRDEQELVAELRALGLRIESVYDLVNNRPHPVLQNKFVGPYREAYPVLLKHVAMEHEPNIREGIIRALIVRDLPPEAHSVLLEQLRAETNRIHRVCLALALRKALGRREADRIPEIQAALLGGWLTKPFSAAVRPNPSIERTCKSFLRKLSPAAHVERYASSFWQSEPSVGLRLRLGLSVSRAALRTRCA